MVLFNIKSKHFLIFTNIILNKSMAQITNTSKKICHPICLIMLFHILFSGVYLHAQTPKKPTSGEIYQMMEKLGFLGSVLYIAAHPDDENTRLISYLANEKKANTTYLSLTRGDGGQNLIGPEISELLGVMRTQELLMARSVDNGKQMFTRANDFGYSKNAEETIKIWDTEKVKADVVWAIRKTRPDVIINRFDHRTSGETHGHHTASAQLSYELFEKAGDAKVNPEHTKYVAPWKPQRLFFNTSWWFYGSEDKFKKADKTALMSMDVGVYFPLLGKSNTEIAAESRSNHKCQGFGSTGTRGMQMEYLELLKGDMPPNKSNIFEGINTTWTRVENGIPLKIMTNQLLANYDFKNPAASVIGLVEIYKAIQKIKDPFWKEIKTNEVKELIAACMGLFLEAKTNIHKVTPGEFINLDIEVINRLNADIQLKEIKGTGIQLDTSLNMAMVTNEPFKWTKQIEIPSNTSITAPYWLTKKGSLGLYNVEDQSIIGNPETKRTLKATFLLSVYGVDISYEKDLVYKYNSPENGETYRPLEIVPPVSVHIKEPVYIFPDKESKEIKVSVHAWVKDQKGSVSIPVPSGWTISPSSIDFNIAQKGENKDFNFTITPSEKNEEIIISPVVICDGKMYNGQVIDINYEHIPFQTVLMQAESKLSRINIETRGRRLAYVMGAGDEIPASLRQIGYVVDILKPEDISSERLNGVDALILGVRTYNTEENLKFKQNIIFDFVKNGGNVIVQYNTANGLVTKELAPYPLTLSRNRVTVEEAEMRMINPEHSVLNFPNKITQKDFDGWVQERGLYFPGEWDTQFTPVLSCNDPGEKPQDGSLLVAKYGEGYYIYTGLSFFRQLPAGVSGAFRLFSNLISIGQNVQP
jgi:LmbE family N-acetylglucosaminyl deacetylase